MILLVAELHALAVFLGHYFALATASIITWLIYWLSPDSVALNANCPIYPHVIAFIDSLPFESFIVYRRIPGTQKPNYFLGDVISLLCLIEEG